MSSADAGAADLEARIDRIEAGYEFLLAYAAQGRTTDRGAGAGREVREHLGRMAEALDGLGRLIAGTVRERDAATAETARAFLDAIAADAEVARGAILLVLAQPDIGSQLVDNLNASIHLRALLTDLFVVDEALKRKAGPGADATTGGHE